MTTLQNARLSHRHAHKEQPQKVRVMWPDSKGRLILRTAFRIGDNPPQATRALAIAFNSSL